MTGARFVMYDNIPLPGLEFLASHPAARPASLYDGELAPTASAITNFWTHVVHSPNCWIWVGSISGNDGYGRINWRHHGRTRTMSAHRFALLIAGTLPVDGVAEHRCNEPLCVRDDADHVIPSTQTSNLAYAVACGRAGSQRAAPDGRTRVQRSLAVRAAVRDGWDARAYAAAAGDLAPLSQPPLF